MAQKIILFRETGFVSGLEIRGTIPNTNVVHNGNILSKTQDQLIVRNLQNELNQSLAI